MKRLLLALALLFFVNANLPAHAGYFADKKAQIGNYFQTKFDKREIKKVIKEQIVYANEHDLEKLSKTYSDDFVSGDGFDKETYFKLIDETWKAYKDISYTSILKDISIEGDKAYAKSFETSIATLTQVEDNIAISGELYSYSNGTYKLKKVDNKWIICGEDIDEEKSTLKYGDTRFIDMDLIVPQHVKAGEYYTSKLVIDKPENATVVASIGHETISYPQVKADEVYRKLPDDNILERMFIANKEGKHEYNVASIAMTKTEEVGDSMNVYMAGIAFIMTRVNVEAADEQN